MNFKWPNDLDFEQKLKDQNQKLKEKLEKHLSKFTDLDKFLDDANEAVVFYFKNQEFYRNIEDFKIFLKKQIEIYIKHFFLTREERNNEKTRQIEENFDKIIYFWETPNPIEERRKRIKQKVENQLK